MIHSSSGRSIYLCTALLAVLATACGGSDSPTDGGGGPVATTSVSVRDNFFSPEDIRVSPGAMVTWTWAGSEPHDVNWTGSNTSGLANSVIQSSGAFQSTMPTTPGTYTYFCIVHGLVMSGSVQVAM